MKTGSDISIRECRASGYAVVEHGDNLSLPVHTRIRPYVEHLSLK